MGVALWPADSDEFSRGQMQTSHTNIEDRAAIFRQDAFANRGSASTWTRSFFYDETNQILYYSDGTEWKKLTDFGTATVKVVPGNTASGGSSDQAARIDHRHEVDPWGTTGQLSQIGTTASSGSTSAYARVDHVHVLGSNSVTAGTIASSAINSSLAFTAGVVNTAALGDSQVTKGKISSDQQLPAGIVMAYVGATAPTGWLLCDGTSYLKTTYPDLWTVLSTQGYGSTTTNFNVPDLRDRMPRGAATTGTSLGATAGADTVTLATGNLPAHSHEVGSLAVATHADHSHTFSVTTDSKLTTHTHDFSHTHTGNVTSGAVTGGGGFLGLEWYYPPGGSSNRYQNGPYSMFDGGDGPQADIGVAQLINTAITTNTQNTSTTGASASLAHTHSGSGTTAVNSPSLTHTVSGSTATVGSGTAVSVLPKTQTVNYIIKT